jgi:hypothetical protein
VRTPIYKLPVKRLKLVKKFENPGPGAYNPKMQVIEKDIRLYRGERVVSFIDRTKLNLPGPGSYELFSEFGNLNKSMS